MMAGIRQGGQFNYRPSLPSSWSPLAGAPGCWCPRMTEESPTTASRMQSERTHRNQSTAMMSVMSSVGRPTDVSTMTMVTRPA